VLRSKPTETWSTSNSRRSPTAGQCLMIAVAFFVGINLIGFTERMIAGFQGSYIFQHTNLRLLRAVIDTAVLIGAIRYLYGLLQRNDWGNRQLIGLLLGSYATYLIFYTINALMLGFEDPVFRITSVAATILSVLLATFLCWVLWTKSCFSDPKT